MRSDLSPDDRLLETFFELVRIDSPSGFEAACAEYCARELAAVGCSLHYDDAAGRTGSDTGNLIAELKGTAPGVLVLSAHLDCVEPCRGVEPVVVDGIIVSAGDTVLGADDKAGLAAAIECVRRLAAGDEPHPTVRCVFTVQEELGLVGAKALDPAYAAGDLCLVLDAAGEPGGIVVAAPTHYTFAAEFLGRAAHAGVAPELGVSAITMAAEAIASMSLGRLDEVSTANVGSIHGGAATNVVTARVDVTGECRSLDRERVERLRLAMDDAMHSAAEKYGGVVNVAWTLEYEGFNRDESDPLVETVAAAVRAIGREPVTFRTGGGSDANVFATAGVPTLALACGMSGVHGTDEQLAVEDLVALTELCTSVAHGMARG